MVLVSFSKEVMEDAKLLPTFSAEVLSEFCKIAVEHVKVGQISKAKYTKAAESLKVELGALITSIQALAHILLEAAHKNVTADELLLSIDELPFKEDQKNSLKESYTNHSRDLRSLLSDFSLRLPHYHNLEWRLDVQLASRMKRNQVQPLLMVELETKDSKGQPTKQMLQMDYANLDHAVKQLEQAVKEVNSKHARRVLRYVK